MLAEAIALAKARHAGQVRKYTGAPYHTHLEEVARLVATSSHADDSLIAAAWLHDAIEDTGTTPEELRQRFGEEVARLVDGVTDVSRPEDGSRAARKALDRAHVAAGCGRIHTLKLADMISNCATVALLDPRFARTYLAEKRALLAVLTRGDPDLLSLAAHTLARGDLMQAQGATR